MLLEGLCKPLIFYFTPIFLTSISYFFELKIYVFAPKCTGQPVITYMRAWMSSKFSQILSGTTELAALEHLKNWCCPFFSFHSCGYTWEIVRWAFTGPLVLWSYEQYWLSFVTLIKFVYDQQSLESTAVFGLENLEFGQWKVREFYFLWFVGTLICVYTEFRATLKIPESFNPKRPCKRMIWYSDW